MRLRIAAAVVLATAGGLLAAPSAQADAGACDGYTGISETVRVHSNVEQRCVVVEGAGDGSVPLDRGYVGAYHNREDQTVSFYASCEGRDPSGDDESFETMHPTASGSFVPDCRDELLGR